MISIVVSCFVVVSTHVMSTATSAVSRVKVKSNTRWNTLNVLINCQDTPKTLNGHGYGHQIFRQPKLMSNAAYLMSLQTTTPASHEMVIFQMMSVRTEIRPTNRSAAARFLMKNFIRDFLPLECQVA